MMSHQKGHWFSTQKGLEHAFEHLILAAFVLLGTAVLTFRLYSSCLGEALRSHDWSTTRSTFGSQTSSIAQHCSSRSMDASIISSQTYSRPSPPAHSPASHEPHAAQLDSPGPPAHLYTDSPALALHYDHTSPSTLVPPPYHAAVVDMRSARTGCHARALRGCHSQLVRAHPSSCFCAV